MIPDDRVCSFHAGQVWESRTGHFWRVTEIKNGQAVMRQGANGKGRIKRRECDAVIGWALFSDPEYPENGTGVVDD